MDSKVEYLVVDTSAFIKNAALQDIGNKIITEPNVVNEIKSKRQLKRLVVLPYDLEVKEAFPEDIKFVTDFAKKTGDYTSLSATDIKVIALTYRYEKEKVGTSHLRTHPEKSKQIVDSSVQIPEKIPKNFSGFYDPDEHGDEEIINENLSNSRLQDLSRVLDSSNTKIDVLKLAANEDSVSDSGSDESDDECLSNYSDDSNLSCNRQDNDLSVKFEKLSCNPEDLKVECSGDMTVDDILKPMTNNLEEDEKKIDENCGCNENDKSQNYSSNEDDDDNSGDDDIDDDSWITPKNITQIKKKMDSGVVKEKPATVACLTMDYAMQNVLMQIGLNIASLDGKVIKEMRTFILRCYTCFRTTGLVTKTFCPSCGNKTLKKVSVTLDDEGKQKIHINFRKSLTSKGKKYSLPTYQGGKHASNPMLFEDQPRPDQRPTKLGRTKNDPLDEDYVAGYSPFVMRDVNSRAAMLGIKGNETLKYWMRRNPNEPMKHKK